MTRLSVYALALAAVVSVPVAADAGAQPHMIFGMVGLTASQTARLNVVNVGNPDLAPATCAVSVGFVDENDAALVPAVQIVLPAGAAAHVDLAVGNPDFIGNPNLRGGRLQFRGVIGAPAALSPTGARTLPPSPCRSALATMEIFDTATGATTTFMNPAVIRDFNPQPDIPGMPAR